MRYAFDLHLKVDISTFQEEITCARELNGTENNILKIISKRKKPTKLNLLKFKNKKNNLIKSNFVD